MLQLKIYCTKAKGQNFEMAIPQCPDLSLLARHFNGLQ